MTTFKRLLALLTALTLVVGCTVAGLVLPAAAESDTFKLAKDELYLSPTDAGGYVVYASVSALTPEGEAYTEALTWSSSNTSVVTVNATTGRIATVSSNKNGTGSAVVTATNAAGESHSCTVYVVFDGECISGGDFESADATGMYSLNRWVRTASDPGILADGSGITLVADPDDATNHCLKIAANTGSIYYGSLTSLPDTTYMISLDIKGDTGEIKPLYISNSTANGWKYATPNADGWKHYSWTYTVKSSVNRSYQFALANQNLTNGTNTNPIYIDNLSVIALGTAEAAVLNSTELNMEIGDTAELSVSPSPEDATLNRPTWTTGNDQVATVDKNGKVTAVAPGTTTVSAKCGLLDEVICTVTVYEDLLAVIPDPNIQNGTVTSDAVIGVVQPSDIVTVTVTPDEGYVLAPGSLKYTTKSGNATVSILNEELPEDTSFGGTAGNTFQFVMPDESVTVTAKFESTETRNFQADTIGTSCRYYEDENGEKVYDGIRFLTRLNLANGFDESSDTLTVTYGGAEYTVLELGSLLKREANTTALTYDNAVANENAEGLNRMWISRAYTKDSGTFKLVDYTDSYIDFASVMLTSHYDRFYTARGYIRLQDKGENVITLEFSEITNSISSVVPILPPVQTVDGVTAEKTCWTPITHTVAPNEEITYQIDVTAGDTAGTVTVFEPIPANTAYVSGADELVGKHAVWTVELAANETKTLTYTVRVADDLDLCNGGTVVATDTQVGDTTLDVDGTLYVERTLSDNDAYYVTNAIKALSDSSYTDRTFVNWVYQVAFTQSLGTYIGSNTSAETLNALISGSNATLMDTVAPTLYGGTEVTGTITGIKGEPAKVVKASDLLVGDVLLVKNDGTVDTYLLGGHALVKVQPTGGTVTVDADTVLATLPDSDAYAVIRPSVALVNMTTVDPDAAPVEYTAEQEAVIRTAEAFLMRGEKVQYDDSRFTYYGPAENRWQLHVTSPEDATVNNVKYTNCAAFCNDSYYFGLDYSLPNNMYTTFNMVRASATNGSQKYLFTRSVTDTHTEAEMQEVHDTFMSILQPGDLMIVLRDTNGDGSDDSGHVMMYVGNGKMIHSTGSSYNYGGSYGVEVREPSIRYGQVEDYFFNPASTNGYPFGEKVSKLCIVRPLDITDKTVPESTANRMDTLTGIVAQKLASHSTAHTVNPGDEITYTFSVRNTNSVESTLKITDTVPSNTTYVSGAETVAGDTLSWTVTVPADSSTTVSYTVKVAADTLGGVVSGVGATINGVAYNCPDIHVERTLTEEEQADLLSTLQEIRTEGTELTGLALVNEIYYRALGIENAFASTDHEAVTTAGFFKASDLGTYSGHQIYEVDTESTYYAMMVPSLYGGRNLYTAQFANDRTRIGYHTDLVVGDVLIGRTLSAYTIQLYIGDNQFINLTNGFSDGTITADDRLERALAYGYYFVVARPSMTIE